jgi:hypothetical protein
MAITLYKADGTIRVIGKMPGQPFVSANPDRLAEGSQVLLELAGKLKEALDRRDERARLTRRLVLY